jgi:hypothetical protein
MICCWKRPSPTWRQGWYVGGARFREKLEAYWDGALAGRRRESHRGQAKGAHDEAAAQRAPGPPLGALVLSRAKLEQEPKSAPEKIVLAGATAAHDGAVTLGERAVGHGPLF